MRSWIMLNHRQPSELRQVVRLAALLAASLAVAASAQTNVQRRVSQAAPVTLTPAAAAVVARFDAETAGPRHKFSRLSSDGGVAASLATRVEIDQALRKALPDLSSSGLSDDDRKAVNIAIWRRIAQIDAENTTYLKSVLPADGWFRNSRDGEQVARDAWLIVQHSPDQAFQREVVTRMASLLTSGEVNGPDYALLYDRTEMFAGRRQRYGSQLECRNGRWMPARLDDPANVDRRRASVGLGPIAQYMEQFRARC